MDQRHTFKDAAELLSIIQELYTRKEKAALIIDRHGLTRVQGSLLKVDIRNNIGDTVIVMEGPDPITLDQVIAVNGIFRSDYSEC